MLTIEDLDKIKDGEIFAQGEMPNQEDGLYMVDSSIGRMLLWIAKKGRGYNDWAIYCHWADNGIEYVKKHGDKVSTKENIQKLVPCTEEVFNRYRF